MSINEHQEGRVRGFRGEAIVSVLKLIIVL